MKFAHQKWINKIYFIRKADEINLQKWMTDLPLQIRQKPLINLAIPGFNDFEWTYVLIAIKIYHMPLLKILLICITILPSPLQKTKCLCVYKA